VLARPVPTFDKPFRPQLQHHVIDTKPFSFDSQTSNIFKKRQQRLNDVMDEEKKVFVIICVLDVLHVWRLRALMLAGCCKIQLNHVDF